MGITLFGNNLSALEEQVESGRFEITAEGVMVVTRVWKATYAVAIANAPAVRSADPGGTGALCISVTIDREAGDIAIVRATYQGYLYLPFTIYEFANTRQERPIEMHPNFNDAAKFPDAVKFFDPDMLLQGKKVFVKFQDSDPTATNNRFRGIEAYITGSAQWRKTSYSTTPDFDQTDVGRLNAPEAGPYGGLPDAGNAGKTWLKMEKTCRNLYKGASLLWEITEVWQYNRDGWRDEIYGT